MIRNVKLARTAVYVRLTLTLFCLHYRKEINVKLIEIKTHVSLCETVCINSSNHPACSARSTWGIDSLCCKLRDIRVSRTPRPTIQLLRNRNIFSSYILVCASRARVLSLSSKFSYISNFRAHVALNWLNKSNATWSLPTIWCTLLFSTCNGPPLSPYNKRTYIALRCFKLSFKR